jgi:hypothetical protein
MRFDPVIVPLVLTLAFGLSTQARVQEPTKALDPAEVIPLGELQGKTVGMVINFASHFRASGYTMRGETTRKVRFRVGENGAFAIRSARESANNGLVHVLRQTDHRSAETTGQDRGRGGLPSRL